MQQGRPIEVDSSVISRLLYVADRKVLYIEFIKTSAVYSYDGVAPSDYEALIKSDSVGSFFTRTFRKRYVGVKVDRNVAAALWARGKPVEIPPQDFIEHLKRRVGAIGF